MLMSPDYFGIAVNEARDFRAKQAREHYHLRPRTMRDVTHWSYYGTPARALCGTRIAPHEFSVQPTCEHCVKALAQMQAEDAR